MRGGPRRASSPPRSAARTGSLPSPTRTPTAHAIHIQNKNFRHKGRLALTLVEHAGRAHHACRAPDVGRRPVARADQNLQTPVLTSLNILGKVMILKCKGDDVQVWKQQQSQSGTRSTISENRFQQTDNRCPHCSVYTIFLTEQVKMVLTVQHAFPKSAIFTFISQTSLHGSGLLEADPVDCMPETRKHGIDWLRSVFVLRSLFCIHSKVLRFALKQLEVHLHVSSPHLRWPRIWCHR